MRHLLRGGAILALLLFSLNAQTVVRTTAGSLKCGALTRSATTVQTYCYLGTTVVHNTISTLSANGAPLPVSFHLNTGGATADDLVEWTFTIANGQVSYVALTGLLYIQSGKAKTASVADSVDAINGSQVEVRTYLVPPDAAMPDGSTIIELFTKAAKGNL